MRLDGTDLFAFSLTYASAIGLSTVLGTLIPPLVKGTLGETLSKPGANWVIAGIVVGVVLREWRGARRVTKVMVGVAFVVLVGAVLSLTYGNRLAEIAPTH